jgi:hypothetical protein
MSNYYYYNYYNNTDTFQFLAHDVSSGGYPCTSRTTYRCAQTEDFEKAVKWVTGKDAHMARIKDPKVYELVLEEVQFKEVETVHIKKHYERV